MKTVPSSVSANARIGPFEWASAGLNERMMGLPESVTAIARPQKRPKSTESGGRLSLIGFMTGGGPEAVAKPCVD